jgi:hypothetical protein
MKSATATYWAQADFLRRTESEWSRSRRQLPTVGNQEWVEFEEVQGPDPDASQRAVRAGQPIARRFDVMFVAPYPRAEEAVGA